MKLEYKLIRDVIVAETNEYVFNFRATVNGIELFVFHKPTEVEKTYIYRDPVVAKAAAEEIAEYEECS